MPIRCDGAPNLLSASMVSIVLTYARDGRIAGTRVRAPQECACRKLHQCSSRHVSFPGGRRRAALRHTFRSMIRPGPVIGSGRDPARLLASGLGGLGAGCRGVRTRAGRAEDVVRFTLLPTFAVGATIVCPALWRWFASDSVNAYALSSLGGVTSYEVGPPHADPHPWSSRAIRWNPDLRSRECLQSDLRYGIMAG